MTSNHRPPLVLIVDDTPTNLDVLVAALKKSYRLGIAKDGENALKFAETNRPDVILLDVMMPGPNGYEVCEKLKASATTREIPVIFITARSAPEDKLRGFQAGGVDFITKPFFAPEVLARIDTHVSLKKLKDSLERQNVRLEEKVREKTAALNEMLSATIQTMALAVEIRDPYTAGHQERVAMLACAIAEKMGLPEAQVNAIRFAGILHDVGKIRIPEAIINRPGKLLSLERELIKIHPQIGFDLLKNIPFPWPIAEIVLQHHEKLDGSGYPRGLSGDEIRLEARILTVADVTEAESSHRPYRPTRGIDSALREIITNRGRLYDGDAVDACRELFMEEDFQFKAVEVSSLSSL